MLYQFLDTTHVIFIVNRLEWNFDRYYVCLHRDSVCDGHLFLLFNHLVNNLLLIFVDAKLLHLHNKHLIVYSSNVTQRNIALLLSKHSSWLVPYIPFLQFWIGEWRFEFSRRVFVRLCWFNSFKRGNPLQLMTMLPLHCCGWSPLNAVFLIWILILNSFWFFNGSLLRN